MPQQASPEQQEDQVDAYGWLKPSPYMDQVKAILDSMSTEQQRQEYFDTAYPQREQLYNIGVNDGRFVVKPLDDRALPIPYTEGQADFIDYPLPMRYPTDLPVLPGE